MAIEFTSNDLRTLSDEIKFLSPKYQELATALVAAAFGLADQIDAPQGPAAAGTPTQPGARAQGAGILAHDFRIVVDRPNDVPLPPLQELFDGSHTRGARGVAPDVKAGKIGGRIGDISVTYNKTL